jgi:hypothetical protein
MPPKRVVKEKVAKRKESEAGEEMAAEEGAEPSAPIATFCSCRSVKVGAEHG